MKSKNLDIQFFKFIYSWVIVLYHLNSFTAINCQGGSFGVEYYLLTAGIFFFMSYEKQEQSGKLQSPGQYLVKRFTRFFPWSTTAYILTAIVKYGIVDPVTSASELMDLFSSDIWEVLLIKWNGMNDNQLLLNTPAWTLSSMCIVGFLLWGCLYYYKDRFINLFMPLTLIVGYGVWRHLPSAATQQWIGFTTFGTFRTWLVTCLSYYCLQLAKKMADIPFNSAGKKLLTTVEILIHIFAILVIFNRSSRYYQWLVTLLFVIAVAIALSGKSNLCQLLNKSRLVHFLGEISMSVYLVHLPVIFLFDWKYDMSHWSYRELMPLMAVILLVSMIHYWFTKWVIRTVPIWSKKLYGKLVHNASSVQ